MMEHCDACGADDAVDYEDDSRHTCRCDECGARFEVEADGEWDDGMRDCSYPGKHINH